MEKDTRAPTLAALIATIASLIAWLCNWYFLKNWEGTDRGTFGDMFGVVNSAFSGLAFIGVVYAIFLQRHEIGIARADAKYTKQILDEQKKQLELQNQETKKQMFESTFFQLLRIFTDLTSQMDISTNPPTKGKDVFPYFLKRLRNRYVPGDFESFESAYEGFYEQWNKDLGHYYRTIFNIMKFIDNSEIPDKKFYSNILRAQLSDAEAALIFHNGLTKYGRDKFKPYMEKYALLKNVNDSDILDVRMRKRYAPSAFGEPV